MEENTGNANYKLPKYIIIQSPDNNGYLHIDAKYPNLPNALRFKGEYSFGLETRFEVVPATTGNGPVHIRSLQNNKYWAFNDVPDRWISAKANKPEEDMKKLSCTLFRPFFIPFNDKFILRLQHVNTGFFVRRHNGFAGTNNYKGCLTLLPKLEPSDKVDSFTIIDWESVVMLPDLIRIKGCESGYHLLAHDNGLMNLLHKEDNSSIFDFEVHPSRDGGIRLKSVAYGNYWTNTDSNPWVWLKNASTKDHDTNTVFLPTIIDGSRIVLQCLMNGMYCKRYTAHSEGIFRDSCLATLNRYPDEFSYMEIEEPFVSRKIHNVRYHLTDARTYNEKTLALISDDTSNGGQEPMTSILNLKTTVSNTTNWNNSVTLKVGVKTTLKIGIPFISEGKIDISAEVTGSWNWGETKTESLEVGTVKTIIVPPMTRLKGSLMATRLSYDIPFSYTQRDVLLNGKTKVSEKNDGLFTAHNGYAYRYKVVPLPLE